MILEGCLDWNPECCRSKRAHYTNIAIQPSYCVFLFDYSGCSCRVRATWPAWWSSSTCSSSLYSYPNILDVPAGSWLPDRPGGHPLPALVFCILIPIFWMFLQGPGYLTGLVVILYLLWSLTALGILYDGSAWGWLGEVARYLLIILLIFDPLRPSNFEFVDLGSLGLFNLFKKNRILRIMEKCDPLFSYLLDKSEQKITCQMWTMNLVQAYLWLVSSYIMKITDTCVHTS